MADNRDRKHPLERLMENPWALLALGFAVPFLSYFVWGVVDLLSMPKALLP
jgi:hypothetical protein